MNRISKSTKIYIILIIILSILGAVNIYLPQGSFSSNLPEQAMPASKPVMALATAGMLLVIYGGLGFLGYRLSQRIGFSDIWAEQVSNRQRFLLPAIIGIGVGIFFILFDALIQMISPLEVNFHPPFPTSLVASAIAGIGEEIIFRLFFVSFWMWLISKVILKGRGQEITFWVVSCFSALVFAIGHVPTVLFLLGLDNPVALPIALWVEIIVLNGVLSIFCAYYFRRFGFLAAVGIHFWTDVVWHVIWGLFS